MLSKVVAMSLLVAGTQQALSSSDQTSLGLDLSKCTGSFQDTVNLLYMNCVDDNGVLVDRYQRLFVKPLIKECGTVDASTIIRPSIPAGGLMIPVDNSTLPIDNST
jgi:hypothetical protein